MNDEERGEAIWINHQALRENTASLEALGTAMSLLMEVWMPSKKGFLWDAEALAAQISAPDATAEALEALKEEVATFFAILDDGRWVPSPIYFALNDANAEQP